jgi:hypothetical protein
VIAPVIQGFPANYSMRLNRRPTRRPLFG